MNLKVKKNQFKPLGRKECFDRRGQREMGGGKVYFVSSPESQFCVSSGFNERNQASVPD